MSKEDLKLLKKLQQKLTKADLNKTEPEILNSLRRHLIDAIKDPEIVDGYKLKLLYNKAFNLPMQTIEMMQLHENQISCGKKFDTHDIQIARIKWGLAALAVAFAGSEAIPFVFNFLGF